MGCLFVTENLNSDENPLFENNLAKNKVISKLKEVFEDHLDAINQNTDEIQANHEYLCELDAKLEKINERIDQVQVFLQKFGLEVKETPKFDVKPLNKREQEVFLVLYTLDGVKEKITYADIARRTGLTEELVFGYTASLLKKGVPIIRRHINNRIYLKLNPHFKDIQAKENILKIDQKTLV